MAATPPQPRPPQQWRALGQLSSRRNPHLTVAAPNLAAAAAYAWGRFRRPKTAQETCADAVGAPEGRHRLPWRRDRPESKGPRGGREGIDEEVSRAGQFAVSRASDEV
ncbi:hypothetical protein PR202_ga10510 [Eleusine coracana subsp. coracana]|uniref:Uncharacterized protein n=1 Tax=Eleusine coracana subsp. coracana TaxID=191504 RepID=A0AAV5C6Y7_ELECO|nr:hypothetical protein PR202_ga10510 [Eleusine coracana subsp. coracana]